MNCRSCGGDRFGEVLNLGEMPLVNNLLKSPDEIAPRYPLHAVFCRACSLSQLTETPAPNAMFDEYLYFSSQSKTMVEHAARLVDRFVKPGDRVLEIASNDGYLLQHAKAKDATVLGIEPAKNIAAFANERAIPTRCEYFTEASAQRLRDDIGAFDVIFANNVLAHVPDPNEIAKGIRVMLARDGVAHIEVPSVVRMIESAAFDTIYHEHYSYFSLTALQSLFDRASLSIADVRLVDIHGGSFHIQVRRAGEAASMHDDFACDTERFVRDDAFYSEFSRRVDRIRAHVNEAIDRFPRVAAMGAAAKGIVLLNAFELTIDRIAWVADVSPHKQGRFVPGTKQPIVPPSRLREEMPDAVLLLPWNLRSEILERNQVYRDQGGKFIVPIPSVEVV